MQNKLVIKTLNAKRSPGCRPISAISLATPTVLKMKKTPTRKITSGFREKVLQKDLAELMG
jgi:hypothetical protein